MAKKKKKHTIDDLSESESDKYNESSTSSSSYGETLSVDTICDNESEQTRVLYNYEKLRVARIDRNKKNWKS